MTSEIVWEFAVLIIQNAKSMLLTLLSSIAYLCVAYFYHINGMILRNMLLSIQCVFSLSLLGS